MNLNIAHNTVDNGGVEENKWVVKLPENCEVDICEETGTVTIQGGDVTQDSDQQAADRLSDIARTYGLYGTLKMLFESSKESCEKFSDVGNMDAVIHGDTLMLMMCLQRMQSCNYSPGGAFMRQLDSFDPPECHIKESGETII
jgi:hypothetical protein